MRVVIASDRIGALDSGAAGVALARGFQAYAQVAVVPIAAGGTDLASAFAQLSGSQVEADAGRWLVRAGRSVLLGEAQAGAGWAPERSSAAFGDWVAAQVGEASEVILDLTGLSAHDGGAGLLQTAQAALTGRTVIGVVADDELSLPASGIGGGLAKRAFAAGVDVAELLAADARLTAWASQHADGLDKTPGAGAAGTTALAVLALGGSLLGATHFCRDRAGLATTMAAADVVVTGCTELSALDRGGPVVSAVSEWAAEALRPVVLFTTGTGLSRRELRTLGIESGHVLASAEPTEAELTEAASRIAAGWLPGKDHLT